MFVLCSAPRCLLLLLMSCTGVSFKVLPLKTSLWPPKWANTIYCRVHYQFNNRFSEVEGHSTILRAQFVLRNIPVSGVLKYEKIMQIRTKKYVFPNGCRCIIPSIFFFLSFFFNGITMLVWLLFHYCKSEVMILYPYILTGSIALLFFWHESVNFKKSSLDFHFYLQSVFLSVHA